MIHGMTTNKSRRGEMTPEDIEAANNLRSIWDRKKGELGLTQESAGHILGFGQSAVSQYLNARIPLGVEAILKWSSMLQVDPDDIRPGISTLINIAQAKSRLWQALGRDRPANTVDQKPPALYANNSVPVISWIRAGQWHEASDPLHPGDAEEWMPCPTRHGPHTYALRVVGDSMTSMHGKSYPEGCLIFVDPDRLDPTSGTPVIAKVNGDDAVTFKVVVKDAGRVWLRALNAAYPPIMEPFRVLGTVIGKWEDA